MTVLQGLQGHLDLLCALDSRGQSILARQSFRSPMHIGKPWMDADTLIVQLVNPTGGLLAGDAIHSRVEVAEGARILVTTPSASRAHRTISGEISLQQNFIVADGGWLEVFPEMFIPQAGTICRQHTRIDLHPRSSLLYIDTLAPGRVAHGESFAFQELDWRTDIRMDGQPLVRERSRLLPDASNIAALRQVFSNAYLGTIYLSGAAWSEGEAYWPTLCNFQSSGLWIGVSQIQPGTWVIKLLATDSPTLHNAIGEIRRTLYEISHQQMPWLRKI